MITRHVIKLLLTYSVVLMVLFDYVYPQISRITQFYPQTSTVTPYAFTNNAVHTGFFIPGFNTYVHSETAATGSFLRVARKDGSLVRQSTDNAADSKSLNFYSNTMVSFGANSDIKLFNFQYIHPDFYTFTASYSGGHNLNLNRAFIDSKTAMHYVSSIGGGKLYKYTHSDLNTPPSQVTFGDLLTIESITKFGDDFLLIAGSNNLIKSIDRAAMGESTSGTTACTSILRVLHDAFSLPQNETRIDVACGSTVCKYLMSGSTLRLVSQFGSATAPINNMIEFGEVNYLLLTYGNDMHIIKRTNFDPAQEFILRAVGALTQGSIACCEDNLQKFTFSTAVFNSIVLSTTFSVFQANFDFCSNYDGSTCIECNNGYKLLNNDLNNRCIMQDEYPYRYGAKGSMIGECQDSNCLRCKNAFYKCEVCSANLHINQESFECSDLSKMDKFGVDTTNSSIIFKCQDLNCLYCKDDYKTCALCQEEYFDLRRGMCVAKESNLTMARSWFVADEMKSYIELSSSFSANANILYPKNLSVSITDSQGDAYTDFSNFKIEGLNSSTLMISASFSTSIYNGKITLSQIPENPVFYNKESYMPKTAELVVEKIRLITSNTYFMIEKVEGTMKMSAWGVMIGTTILGSVYNPLFGTMLMRAVCVLNLVSHLNGPNLHSSDMMLNILGNVSIPFNLQDMIRTPQEDLICVPEDNFSKRFQSYSSCSIIDMYGKSMIFSMILAIVAIPLSIVTCLKVKEHHKKIKNVAEYSKDEGLATLIVVNRYAGIRFLSAIFNATTPIVLQYAILNLVKSGNSIQSQIISVFCMLVFVVMIYCLFRFTHNLLDVLYLRDIKTGVTAKAVKKDSEKPFKFKEGESRSKGINIVIPKQTKDGAIQTKDGKLVVDKKSDDLNFIGLGTQKSSMAGASNIDDSGMTLDLSPSAATIRSLDLELSKVKYNSMDLFVQGFKQTNPSTRVFFYYLPMAELVNSLITSYIIVRFSGSGMVQVYLVTTFEVLLMLIYSFLQPYKQKLDFTICMVYKSLVLVVFITKLFNFIMMPEETARQRIIDTSLLIILMILIVYCTGVSIYCAIRGVKKLLNFKADKELEVKIMEEDKRESQADKVKDSSAVKEKPHTPFEKSISGISDSPVRRDIPKRSPEQDRIFRANKLTNKNNDKIKEDNKRIGLSNKEFATLHKDDMLELQTNDSPEKISPVRPNPIIETVQNSKRTDGVFTIAQNNVSNLLKFRTIQPRNIKPEIKVKDGIYSPQHIQSNNHIIDGMKNASDSRPAFEMKSHLQKNDSLAQQLSKMSKDSRVEGKYMINIEQEDNLRIFSFKSRAANLKNIN